MDVLVAETEELLDEVVLDWMTLLPVVVDACAILEVLGMMFTWDEGEFRPLPSLLVEADSELLGLFKVDAAVWEAGLDSELIVLPGLVLLDVALVSVSLNDRVVDALSMP